MDDITFATVMSQQSNRKMPQAALLERVTAFLTSVNIGVLATTGDDRPRATPIEYYTRGTTFYMVADPGIKVKNIQSNPAVSIGVTSVAYTEWERWQEVKGAQVTGQAELLWSEDPGYHEAGRIYRWQHYAKARGWDLNSPPRPKHYIRVTAERIQYRDLSLLIDGYARVQMLNLRSESENDDCPETTE
jgi:nitroimidazol reductase NimA-like FMN-containing flavoprotein (pyridoxamine 5'-phosphate oxidase superfamily)